MTKLICAALFILTLYSCGKTNPDKDKERIVAVCDKFMGAFRDGKVPEAIQLLKQNSILGASSLDSLQGTIINQLNSIILPNYGNINSYEFIEERQVKDFLAKRFYIIRFDKYYLKVDFTLYKGSEGWTITNFKYNEDLIEVLY